MPLAIAATDSRLVKRRPIAFNGAHGLGDNLHQRACIRQILKRHEVWLYTSWPCVYFDMIDDGLHLLHKQTHLRTQTKNAQREKARFEPDGSGRGILYQRTNPSPPDGIRRLGSVLAAMCEQWGCDYKSADFRFEVPRDWDVSLLAMIDENKWPNTPKPLMILRPLTERPKDWRGCKNRNPDFAAYAELYRTIRDHFFVVSIADLQDDYEWMVGEHLQADIALHSGELTFEQMAALFSMADLVFCSPGFAVILAQAVGTPIAAVFGGYEDSRSFMGGARHSPYLGIDPIRPCRCFSHNHACDKRIDIPKAKERLLQFVHASEM